MLRVKLFWRFEKWIMANSLDLQILLKNAQSCLNIKPVGQVIKDLPRFHLWADSFKDHALIRKYSHTQTGKAYV